MYRIKNLHCIAKTTMIPAPHQTVCNSQDMAQNANDLDTRYNSLKRQWDCQTKPSNTNVKRTGLFKPRRSRLRELQVLEEVAGEVYEDLKVQMGSLISCRENKQGTLKIGKSLADAEGSLAELKRRRKEIDEWLP
jgi:hypothetical protein